MRKYLWGEFERSERAFEPSNDVFCSLYCCGYCGAYRGSSCRVNVASFKSLGTVRASAVAVRTTLPYVATSRRKQMGSTPRTSCCFSTT